MIKYFHDKRVQKGIYMTLAVVVVCGFVLSGIVLSDKNHSVESLGQIDNRKITVQDYLNSYNAIDRQIRMRFGEQAPLVRSRLNLKGEAWDRILLSHQAKKDGLKVSDSEVVQWLMSQPVFFTKNQFDENLYKMFLANFLRVDARVFEEDLRQTLLIGKLGEKLGQKTAVSDEEIRQAYDDENGEIEVAYGYLPIAVDPNIEIKDDEIEKLLGIVGDQLTQPGTDKKLTPEETRAEVKKILGRQKSSEPVMKKLDDAKAKLAKDNSNFDAVLGEVGVNSVQVQKLPKGGTLPLIGKTDNLIQVVTNIKDGEVAGPVVVEDGAILVKRLKKHAAADKDFEAQREKYASQARGKKSEMEMGALLEKLRNDLKLNLDLYKKIFPEEQPENK